MKKANPNMKRRIIFAFSNKKKKLLDFSNKKKKILDFSNKKKKILDFSNMRRCSQCKFCHFCSAECQRKAWPDHRDECKAMARASSWNFRTDNIARLMARTIWKLVQQFFFQFPILKLIEQFFEILESWNFEKRTRRPRFL
jgi:radical SAM protein with 4Fe4S-binding SPASM domain